MPSKRTDSTTSSTKTPTRKTGPKRASAPKTARRTKKTETVDLSPDERRHQIAEAAYYRAEARGFQPGFEIEDWLGAERAIDETLTTSA